METCMSVMDTYAPTETGRFKVMAHLVFDDEMKTQFAEYGIDTDTLWFSIKEYDDLSEALMGQMVASMIPDPCVSFKLVDTHEVLTLY